ncbi:MAG: hypothetical protein ABL908_20930 [Hyphomicrobium sp.]
MRLIHAANFVAGSVIGFVVGHVLGGWLDGRYLLTGAQWCILVAMFWGSGVLMSSWRRS